MTDLLVDHVGSPVGDIVIVSDGRRVCSLEFGDLDERLRGRLRSRYGDVRLREAADPGGATSALRAYLGGDAAALDALEVETGGTPFQRRVWSALREIPYGRTATYGALARAIGHPTASRAVGITNSLNPVAIVVPCHRVIGADATLTGYAGGLHRKHWLLEHESAQLSLLTQPV